MVPRDWVWGSNLRTVLTRSCLALLVATQVAVGVGVFALVEHFLWRTSDGQLLEAVRSLWEHRPAFMQGENSELPGLRPHLTFSEWGPHFGQMVAVSVGRGLVRIYRDDGALLFANGPARGVPDLDAAAVAKILSPGSLPQSMNASSEGQRFHILCLPLVARGQCLGVLQVTNSSEGVEVQLRKLALFILLCSLAALVPGYLWLLWLAHTLASPLERLKQTALRMGAGDLQARTGLGGGRNEVFAVAAAFDSMAVRLQASFQSQRRFVADASHELKTPLTTLSGMAEVLQMSNPCSDPQTQKALRTIEREVERMNGLVSDLLELSRAEEPHPQDVAAVSIHEILDELVEEASMRARTVGCECPAELAVRGPESRLRRIFGNLLDNALQYTPSTGTVCLRAYLSDSGMVAVEVSDNGAGISSDDLPHVFERFYRADHSRARRSGGTGLGLAIVWSLVESLQGQVEIRSTPGFPPEGYPGQGTTVTVRLPACRRP
ncbi:HAMP domain-containing histidine kinase [bacterium]|nr:HAMP domain-containing histidine kinase [bacterium]